MFFRSVSNAGAAIRAVGFGTAALACFVIFGLAIKANAATDDLTAQAVIVGPVSIDCSAQELNFGAIVASGVAGTVAVSTSGTATDGGGATYVSGAEAGECLIGGNLSAPYEISYVVNTVTGPGTDMTVTNVVSDNLNGDGPFAGLGVHTASLNATGADTLIIGGTLNVGANQVTGTYTGTIDVTVNYP